MHTLIHLRRRGGRVVVINPAVEIGLVNFSSPGEPCRLLFGSDIASLYVQQYIGGDLALLTGMAKRIKEIGAIDVPFLEQHCNGVCHVC